MHEGQESGEYIQTPRGTARKLVRCLNTRGGARVGSSFWLTLTHPNLDDLSILLTQQQVYPRDQGQEPLLEAGDYFEDCGLRS